MVSDQDIAFLVPDSCRMTMRNDNSADFSGDTIKKLLERRLFLLFLDNLAVALEHFKFICTRRNRTEKTHQKLAFLPAFIKLVQINKIFSDNIRKLSIFKRSKIRLN